MTSEVKYKISEGSILTQMIKKRYSIGTARVILMLALVSIAMLVLAACGGSSGATDTVTMPTSAPTSAIAAPTSVMTAGSVPVATAQATDMPLMGATATTGSGSTSDGALPTGTAAGPASGADSTAIEIKGVLKEWAINLSQQEAPAGKIRFTVTNEGQMQHNFTITNSSGMIAQTPTFAGSEGAQTLDVDLQAGTYTIICDLPGHAARGQKTTLVVK